MKTKTLVLALMAGLLAAVSCSQSKRLTDLVDPMIGSGEHGHVFVGANVPFGMVQLGPQQINDSWDWCSGYHISDTLIIGFSHKHLSGTGIGDLGDILLMPFDDARTLRTKGYVSNKKREVGHIYAPLDHSLESVRPGLYCVQLPAYGVKARLTATERVGLHEYNFDSDRASLVVDLQTGIGWDSCTVSTLKVVDPLHIEGTRSSRGWAQEHTWHFWAEFSEPIVSTEKETLENDGDVDILHFDLGKDRKLMVKVALSPNGCQQARANMEAEMPGWDFDAVAQAADDKWEKALSSIEIEPMDSKQEKIFYTSLYHTMMAPQLCSDAGQEPRYTILSLWDTYRAENPMLTLIAPQLSRDLADTYMDIYRKRGQLPVWDLDGWETYCMVGNPGVISLADLVLKGFVEDEQAAYEALVASSRLSDRGLDLHGRYGFIPFDCTREWYMVSKSMEYAIADACVAKVARKFSDDKTAEEFEWRSKAYERYFDPESGFMRSRNLKGEFRTPFNPFSAEWDDADYVEGNAWQYTFLVPHDVQGLIDLFGEERFTQKLDSLFVVQGDGTGNVADMTGLIGQYAHGNEPSHHIVYMYNWLEGQQYKCAELVRMIMDEMYFDEGGGVCGNEDCGQMSAWYILSALGIYQVDPAGGDFALGSPAVKSAKVHLGDDKVLNIKALNNSPENIYLRSASWNGVELEKPFISWESIREGGELVFEMTNER